MKQFAVDEVIEIMTKSLVEPYVDATGHFWFSKVYYTEKMVPQLNFLMGPKNGT